MHKGYLVSLGLMFIGSSLIGMDSLRQEALSGQTGGFRTAAIAMPSTAQLPLIAMNRETSVELQQQRLADALRGLSVGMLATSKQATMPTISLSSTCAEQAGPTRVAAEAATMRQTCAEGTQAKDLPQARVDRIIQEQDMAVTTQLGNFLYEVDVAPGTYKAIVHKNLIYITQERVDEQLTTPVEALKNYQQEIPCRNGATIKVTGSIMPNGIHHCIIHVVGSEQQTDFAAYAYPENTWMQDIMTNQGIKHATCISLPIDKKPLKASTSLAIQDTLSLPPTRTYVIQRHVPQESLIMDITPAAQDILANKLVLRDTYTAIEPSLQPFVIGELKARVAEEMKANAALSMQGKSPITLPGVLETAVFLHKIVRYVRSMPALVHKAKKVMAEGRAMKMPQVDFKALEISDVPLLTTVEKSIYGTAAPARVNVRQPRRYEEQLAKLLFQHGIPYEGLRQGFLKGLAKVNETGRETAKNLQCMPTESVEALAVHLRNINVLMVEQHRANLGAASALIDRFYELRDSMQGALENKFLNYMLGRLEPSMPPLYAKLREAIATRMERSAVERLAIEQYMQVMESCDVILAQRSLAESKASVPELAALRDHLAGELQKYNQIKTQNQASIDVIKRSLQKHIDQLGVRIACKHSSLQQLTELAGRIEQSIAEKNVLLIKLSPQESSLWQAHKDACEVLCQRFKVVSDPWDYSEKACLDRKRDYLDLVAVRWALEDHSRYEQVSLGLVKDAISSIQRTFDVAIPETIKIEELSRAAHLELMREGSQEYHKRPMREITAQEPYTKILAERLAELQAAPEVRTREQQAELYYVTYELTQTTWDIRAAEYTAFIAAEEQQSSSEFSKDLLIAARSALASRSSLRTVRVVTTPEIQKACALHGFNLPQERVFFGDAIECELYRESAIMMDRGVRMETMGIQRGSEKLVHHGNATRSWASIAEASARKHLGQTALLCNRTAEVSWKLGRAVALGTVDGIIEAGSTCLLHPQRLVTGIADSLVGGYKLIGCILDRACTAECALEVFQQNPERGAALFAEIDRYREANPDMLAQLHKALGSYQTNTPWDQQLHDIVKELTQGYCEGRVLCALGGLARHTTDLTAEHITTAAAAAVSKVSPKVQTALAASGADAQKLAQEVAGIESGLCKQVGVTPGKIRNPDQVAQKIGRFIQTPRLKIANLEKYFAQKLAITKTAIFERANLKHLFGIEKTQKIRAAGKIEATYAGFHHDKGWSLVKKGKVKFLTEPVVCPKTGIVTVEKMLIEGVKIEKKTFFPPIWNRSKVIDKIFEASQTIVKTTIEGNRKIVEGVTKEGMKVLMVIDENKRLVTAYPIL